MNMCLGKGCAQIETTLHSHRVLLIDPLTHSLSLRLVALYPLFEKVLVEAVRPRPNSVCHCRAAPMRHGEILWVESAIG